MNLLSAENISKAFADKELFSGLTFGLAQGQKVALIGINGSGKSTLLKILAGIHAPDGGTVSTRKGIRLVYLSQTPDLPEQLTVSEAIFASDNPMLLLIREYEALIALPEPSDTEQARIQEIILELDAQNAWDYENHVHQVLSKLQVHYLDRKISSLSGGQQKRVALAQALVMEPDVLIMDEPTNHLDLESIEWLEKILSTSKQTLMLVTHDRYFLDSITNEIVELDQGKIFSYKGNYSYFLEKKEERNQLTDTGLERARSLYKKELEWLRRSPKARGTKSKSRIDAAKDLHKETIDTRNHQGLELRIKGRRIGGQVLEIKKLSKSYGDLKIVSDFTYTFKRRDRIGIVGPNGVGKTTFLNLVLGNEAPDSGKVRKGETIHFGYYTQSGWKFKDNQRVIEVITEAAESVELSKNERLSASQVLEHFLFPRRMHHQMVETLSGGEKRRLHLLRILMTNPNFLILDEPTNDLDLITLRKLEDFLSDFDGCLMIVSHDRYFMDRLVDHTFVFEGKGIIKDFPGSYSQYRNAQIEQEQAAQAGAPKKVPKETSKKNREKENRPKKASFKEKREFEQLELEIEEMETKKSELQAQINSGESDYQLLEGWAQELEALNAELSTKSDRWLELSELIE